MSSSRQRRKMRRLNKAKEQALLKSPNEPADQDDFYEYVPMDSGYDHQATIVVACGIAFMIAIVIYEVLIR